MLQIYKAFLLVFFIVLAWAVSAISQAESGLVISEIMYDTPGSDTGREWIEVQNLSSASINLGDYSFFDGSGHSIRVPDQVPESALVLGVNKFAVIASNAEKFKADNPQFAGVLLISSFTLKNTTATIALTREGERIFEYTYSSEQGAQGDGNTLQNDSGTWKVLAATPGRGLGAGNGDGGNGDENPEPEPTQENPPQNSSATVGGSNSFFEPTIFASITAKKSAFIGLETSFEGAALGKEKTPLSNARYIWNFGDAIIAEGKKVFHTYRQKGVYSVTLTVNSGENSASSAVDISVVVPKIVFSDFLKGDEGYIALQNASDQELVLDRLGVRNAIATTSSSTFYQSAQTFYFPENTRVKAKGVIHISMATLGFFARETLQLLDPGGRPVMLLFYQSDEVAPAPQKTVQKATAKKVVEKAPEKLPEKLTEKAAETQVAAVTKTIETKEDVFSTKSVKKTGQKVGKTHIVFIFVSIVIMGVFCARIFLKKKS